MLRNNMENDPAAHSIYLSTSAEMQRSAQAVCIPQPDGRVGRIYQGEGLLVDSWFIPAIVHDQVKRSDVHIVVNPEDFQAGVYDGLGEQGGPQ
jgi:hypothetical protein